MRSAPILALLFTACAPEALDETAEPPAEAPALEEPEPIDPLEGLWTVQSRTVVQDDCGGLLGEDSDDGSDTMELWVSDESAFTMVIEFDDGERFEIGCLREDGVFVCEGDMELYEISDTILSVSFAGGGELLNEGELHAELAATASCEGSLCDVAEDYLETALPCDGAMAMEAVFLAEI